MILILHNIRSLYNVGSVFRTADGAGVTKIYLTGITPSPLDRLGQVRTQISKTALGATNTVAWEKKAQLLPIIKKLKKEGYQIVAVELDKNAVSYKKYRPKNRQQAFIFGNEVSGLSSATLQKADIIIEIPMDGAKESLNVSVAAGIIAYHFKK